MTASVEAPIRAVIFDLDGTLLTTGGAGAVAWDKAFQEVFGKSVDIAKVTESGMTDTMSPSRRFEPCLTASRAIRTSRS
jgi:beta-phosphoglucomutase-like phosphatase (HAD superfamily)